MNVRLVAYRKSDNAATEDKAYNLDLQESPNVSLNYQFADIKEPEKRKGSFSQTFKLPFTENNNEFFQNWYNVNLDTLVYSTRTKFDAVLFVGTTPQFEGKLQLKSVYKKAGLYEVVLLSNSATLFTIIGQSKLKDVFKNDDGSFTEDFNHVYNQNTLSLSWLGLLNNTSGQQLELDGVSQIIYPLSVTRPNFYYNGGGTYLGMDQTAINNFPNVLDPADYTVQLTQFRPSIQLRTLFRLIMAKAGFSYTSNFIDGDYFKRLYMTTGNHLESSAIPTTNQNQNPSGLMYVANSQQWGVIPITPANESSLLPMEIMILDETTPSTADGIPIDTDGIWNTTNNFFTKEDYTMQSITVSINFGWNNCAASPSGAYINCKLQQWDNDPSSPTYNSLLDNVFGAESNNVTNLFTTASGNYWYEVTIDLSDMPTGTSACICWEMYGVRQSNPASSSSIQYGGLGQPIFTGQAVINWLGYSTNIFGATVNFPSCIDPDITQRAFLKDIIERFNLVVLTDPDDDSNLIIEPYNDYIQQGQIKYWTDKLDTSKEIVVKDTTEIQKKIVNLSDQEDTDLNNLQLKNLFPDINVFGHIKITDWGNDFASGELKNNSIFSPFINDNVYSGSDTSAMTILPNLTVQYEFSYEQSDGVATNPIKKTKPKLFYYCGNLANITDNTGTSVAIYLHTSNFTTGAITAYGYSLYPVCSPFDVDINSSATSYNLTSDTNSLYWNSTPPLNASNLMFNTQNPAGNWFKGSLYGKYWRSYLNQIYSENARIMEAYINLDAFDIFDFKFNDEFFIKDCYWRILKIQNYQVGVAASTKVTFIKSLDTLENCSGCNYTLGFTSSGQNFVGNYATGIGYYLWCPDDDPSCVPSLGSNSINFYANPECCDCNGGFTMWNEVTYASQNLYPCLTYAGSPPQKIVNQQSPAEPWGKFNLKKVLSSAFGQENKPFIIGSAHDKYKSAILPYFKDDYIIKYKNKSKTAPQVDGENHKIILLGYTQARVTSFAFPNGVNYEKNLTVPSNINLNIRLKGISTIIKTTDQANFPLGQTEAFGYVTAFRLSAQHIIQIGTTGGVREYELLESGASAQCTVFILVQNGILKFAISDNQEKTDRSWELTVDIDANRLNNMIDGHNESYALFQNGSRIQLQNNDYLLWN